MDLLKNLMDPNKSLQRIVVPGAQVDGALDIEPIATFTYEETDLQASNYDSNDYAKAYQEKEAKLYADTTKQHIIKEGSMSEIDGDDMVSSSCLSEVQAIQNEQLTEVYSKFNFKKTKSEPMTIDSYRDNIMNMINTNEVVIIQGPTGCGKTTQVPQFILDECKANSKLCNIVVTQPRRIAAISVARRVCEERGWGLGTVCGYQVGLESNKSVDTILTYVTTGVLLQKIIKQKNLREYTHIIIDEVHERNQDMDFLLLVIRKFLFLNSPNIKVILMSATIETDDFADYFKNYSRTEIIPAPIITVTKPNIYQNLIYYAEQFKNWMKHVPEYSIVKPQIHKEIYELFVVVVRALDVLDTVDVATNKTIIGNVLVFLPGILEIEEAHRQLKEGETRELISSKAPKKKWQILPLHSSLTTDEQRKVFFSPPPGTRKIILSTNIAESSLTVPDIVYVIDFCLTKTMVVNSDTKYQSLQLEWASHVNCTQRAGRVGRLSHGRVYRLVSREFYEQELSKNIVPEILRAPLDSVILASKMLELNEPPKAILALAMNPPNLRNIESTIWSLKECGALTVKMNSVLLQSDGDLTFLGKIMAQLPLDVKLSKLIVLGHMFSSLRDCIIMAAGSSLNNIFTTPFQERLKAYTNKLMWSDASCSDLIALLNLYKVWEKNKRTNAFSVGTGESGWIRQNYLNARSLREWQILIKELTDRLETMGIKETVGPGKVVYKSIEVPLILKVVMCGAFYPNYFVRSSDGGQVDEKEAVKILGGRDPYRTVYFSNMDNDQPGQLYTNSIQKFFPQFDNVRVSFDSSKKIYVQFSTNNQLSTVFVDGYQTMMAMPGRIAQEVYQAVRRRQLGIRAVLDVLPLHEALRRVKDIEQKSSFFQQKMLGNLDVDERQILPQLDQQFIKIEITELIDAGHFWAQHVDPNTKEILFKFSKALNSKELQPLPAGEKVKAGQLYAAKFNQDNLYYRSKVIHIGVGRQTPSVQVLFIDYGNTQVVSISGLRMLPEDMKRKPAQAMECVLCGIQPSLVLNQRGLWSEKANKMFDSRTKGVYLYGKVYSVVNGVVHFELYRSYPGAGRSEGQDVSLNSWLIQEGFAQTAEESYLSKENHLKRVQIQESEGCEKSLLFEEIVSYREPDIEAPKREECTEKIELKGPFSPLEMHLFGLTNSSLNKSIKIESNSINTVLLDTEPQDPHARLVVAAYLNENVTGTTLSLRNTAVMPNVHGFHALMSLIFCPQVDLKPVEDGSLIGAILCGLGSWGDSTRPLYSQHDMAITLDTELTVEELSKVNELRFWMNESIDVMECLERKIVQPRSSMELCQNELKLRLFEKIYVQFSTNNQLLSTVFVDGYQTMMAMPGRIAQEVFRLLKRSRKSIPRTTVKFSNVWKKYVCTCELLRPTQAANQCEIWPPHWAVALKEKNTKLKDLETNIIDLKNIAQGMEPMPKTIVCVACNYTMFFLNNVRLHISSDDHKKKVEMYATASQQN